MRPLSTYNVLTAVGSSLPTGLSINASTINQGLQVVADMQETEDPGYPAGGQSNHVSIGDASSEIIEISPLAQRLADKYLKDHSNPHSESIEPDKHVDSDSNTTETDPEEDPKVVQAKKDETVMKVGFEIVGNMRDAEEKEKIRDLKERDKKVREREQEHQRLAGNLTDGTPVYRYEIGPDGKQYAVEGHTNIRVREGRTPEKRLRNAERAERAARAGGAVTPQSSQIAFEAGQEASKARKEIEEHEKQDDKDTGIMDRKFENQRIKSAISSYKDNNSNYILKKEQLD
ncbi:MAG: putative metalloprotease CJM1_0395 family protein [Candidatus Electryonea clarkiae]|nr:putative metalloprotease CJM1_0395 family protein [Candidatus Electryonea clarkiae]MDP8285680.1 putative metalloprotease CJM1_0395 family protein [Candidatus Electryonea clarkiae]